MSEERAPCILPNGKKYHICEECEIYPYTPCQEAPCRAVVAEYMKTGPGWETDMKVAGWDMDTAMDWAYEIMNEREI